MHILPKSHQFSKKNVMSDQKHTFPTHPGTTGSIGTLAHSDVNNNEWARELPRRQFPICFSIWFPMVFGGFLKSSGLWGRSQ
jgi:hypothetical protein